MNVWLQLGLGGAALYLLYIIINKLFAYLENRNNCDVNSNSKFDRLCDKIDRIIESNNNMIKTMSETLLNNQKNNEGMKTTADLTLQNVIDIKEMVSKVDAKLSIIELGSEK